MNDNDITPLKTLKLGGLVAEGTQGQTGLVYIQANGMRFGQINLCR
jgi:hypothetical protein